MTSASELFYNRRSRYNSRATHNDLGFDSLCPPDRIYNRRHYNHHHDSASAAAAACDVFLGRPSSRHHRVSLTERGGAGIGPEQAAQSDPGNRVGAVTGNERLPGAVVLARERLLERLRGMPPSENRRHRALQIYRSGLMFREDLGSVDERDAQSASDSQSSDLSSQIESLQLLQEANKKPPGLTQEDLDCLSIDFFCGAERGVDGLVSRASRDCSICLESFMDREELICLPCAHRFHSACLGPWVRIQGDCPYCRRVIVVDSHTAKQTV